MLRKDIYESLVSSKVHEPVYTPTILLPRIQQLLASAQSRIIPKLADLIIDRHSPELIDFSVSQVCQSCDVVDEEIVPTVRVISIICKAANF